MNLKISTAEAQRGDPNLRASKCLDALVFPLRLCVFARALKGADGYRRRPSQRRKRIKEKSARHSTILGIALQRGGGLTKERGKKRWPQKCTRGTKGSLRRRILCFLDVSRAGN